MLYVMLVYIGIFSENFNLMKMIVTKVYKSQHSLLLDLQQKKHNKMSKMLWSQAQGGFG